MINTSKDELGLGERKPLSSLNKRQRELLNMFTKGEERLIIRGNGSVIKVSEEMLNDLINGTYGKFSGHTHPPGHSNQDRRMNHF